MANPKTEAQAALKKAETTLTKATEKAQTAQQRFVEAEMERVIAEREYTWHKANPALLDPPTIGGQPFARWANTNVSENQATYEQATAEAPASYPQPDQEQPPAAPRQRRPRRTRAEIDAAKAAEQENVDGSDTVVTPLPMSPADFAPPSFVQQPELPVTEQSAPAQPEQPVSVAQQEPMKLYDAQGREVVLPDGFGPPF